MARIWKLCILGLLLVMPVVLLHACDDSSNSTYSYFGTQSPGDLWSATFGGGTFTATNNALSPALTFSGTTEPLPSGFLKLMVVDSTDTVAVPLSSVGYAFEFPGTAIFMKPPGTDPDTRAVFLIANSASSGFTPGMAFNWLVIPSSIWDSTTSNALGNGTVTNVSGTAVTININEFMLDGTQTTTGVDNFLTDQGAGQMTGVDGSSDTLTFQVAPSGAFMGDVTPPTPTPIQVAGFVGMKAPAASVNTADILTPGREFRGVLFRNADTPHTETIWANVIAGPVFQGGNYTDIEAGTTMQNVTIDLGTQVSPGVYSGTIDDPSPGVESAVFMVNQIGGKYLIFGIGAHTSTEPFNFMLIEQ